MSDIAHQWGSDLSIGSAGDLALASGTTLGQQRVLRRLLTNPGDYIWQLGYGAGLAGFIGQTTSPTQIAALIRSQIFRESVVARTPEPDISVAPLQEGASAGIFVSIRYVDMASGSTQILSFSVGA